MSTVPPLGAIAAFVLVFLASFAVAQNVVISVALAALAAAAVGLILHGALPSPAGLDGYRADAKRRVAKVLRTVEEIKGMSRRVDDVAARADLDRACELIPELLARTDQNEPTSVASTAARMNVYLASVSSALEQYLEIQQAGNDVFPNAPQLLTAGQEGFADFKAFAVRSIQQVTHGDVVAYRANLNTLAPMTLPELT